MKFTLLFISVAFLSGIIPTYAQTVNFISPPFDSVVHAGTPFTVSVQFQDTTSSVYVAALVFGEQPGGDPSNQELGPRLVSVFEPTFNQHGPKGEPFVQNVTLTLPAGITGLVNITCGEFYALGAVNTPMTFVTKTRVNVQ